MAAVVTLQMRLNVYCSLGWRVPTPTHPVVGAWWKPCRSSPSWHHRRSCLRSCGRLRSGVPAWTPIIAQDDRAIIWVECGEASCCRSSPRTSHRWRLIRASPSSARVPVRVSACSSSTCYLTSTSKTLLCVQFTTSPPPVTARYSYD